MNIKKTYTIPQIECPECALHIVERLEKVDYVDEFHIDYDALTLTIIGDEELSIEKVNEIITAITQNEHDNNHQYKNLKKIITNEYKVENIDCANCALKVERALNKDDNIIEAKVNFVSKKIIIRHLGNVEIYNVVSKVVSGISSKATVIDETRDKEEKSSPTIGKNTLVISLIIGICFFVSAILLDFLTSYDGLTRIVYVLAYSLLAYDIIVSAIKEIKNGEFFNENILMIIASLGAVVIGENIEGILVILLFKIGEYFQDKATNKSRNAIQSLLSIKSDVVTLKDGTVKNVKEVGIGEIITVRVGERIPLDGVVKMGETNIDTKTLTGESMPQSVKTGETILSGSINLTRVIDIEVTKRSDESTITKVLKLVEEASNQKSHSEKFVTKFARIYTPCILVAAFLVGILEYFLLEFSLTDTLNNVFTILVIACPCALVISIPLSYFSGIGRSSSEGILVKGGNYLESLTNVDAVIFDKTGTITKGNFKVVGVYPVNHYSEKDILEMMAAAEQYSLHPIATAVKEAYAGELQQFDNYVVEEIAGAGLKVQVNSQIILVGNQKLMQMHEIAFNECEKVGTVVYVAVDNEFYGSVVISDEIKEHSASLIERLKENKIKTLMLTGDNYEVAYDVATNLGIDEFYFGLLPQDKYEQFKKHLAVKIGNIVYVGDGINDTPSLKLADVGIAMGAFGSDSAKECADVVIMNDDIYKVYTAIEIAKYTKKIVFENIFFALAVKLLALIFGTLGIFSQYGMLVAIFADVGVCLLVILNVLRITKFKLTPVEKIKSKY